MNPIELPLILSGPIVRRVEPTHLYVWIATSRRYQIEAALYKIFHQIGEQEYQYQALEINSNLSTVKIGKRLL